jgi:hypothetical protein
MTFEEFWADTYKGGLAGPALLAAEGIARSTWDAPLCAAQAACFDRGEIRPAGEIIDSISKLHTWVKPAQS